MSCCNPESTNTSTTEDRLIVGNEINTHSLLIAAGETLTRGDVLYLDGIELKKMIGGQSAAAHAIAAYDFAPGATAQRAEVYVEGRFNEALVDLGGANLENVKVALSSDIQLVKRY